MSAPTYFRSIVNRLIAARKITQDSFVIAEHHHTNPQGVLEDLKKHKSDGKTYKEFKHRWIVIDRDVERVNGGGHSKEDFNNALNEAQRLKVDVAYSNDAFELWYLLHFAYRDTAILRDEILHEVIAKLRQNDPHRFSRLDKSNIKNANYVRHIFEALLELQPTAIMNAKRLLSVYLPEHSPERDNPCTTVHLLVEILNTLHTP